MLTRTARFINCLPGMSSIAPSSSLNLSSVFRIIHGTYRSCRNLRTGGRGGGTGVRRLHTGRRLLSPFHPLSYSLRGILKCQCVACHFKQVTLRSCRGVGGCLVSSLDTVFIRKRHSRDFMCNTCFISPKRTRGMSTIFHSLRFRHVSLGSRFRKAPTFTCRSLRHSVTQVGLRVRSLSGRTNRVLSSETPRLVTTGGHLRRLSGGFSVHGVTTQVGSDRSSSCVLYK